MSNPSRVFVIAGPNGAGKTTFALRLLREFAAEAHFLNADLIAAGLSPLAPERAAVSAGRLLLSEIDRLSGLRADFAIESTLSGRGYIPWLQQLRTSGYEIWLIYYALSSPALARQRIEARVRNGGHNIPPEDAVRRFHRSLHNFFAHYRSLADVWMLFDNTRDQPSLVAEYNRGVTRILDQEAYQNLEQLSHAT